MEGAVGELAGVGRLGGAAAAAEQHLLQVPHFILLSAFDGQQTKSSLSHEIQNLQTYTQYKVTVQVFNPEGLGPETTILVMTDEGGEW
ncbi:GD21435 [Drosophila simulans]|uniref:GD21435 n=1 Tax=Drosophila simulans TaxID=7240 RepID=B4R037_DROSI|nr:GD21435 [Drosophila simulans]